MKKKDKEIKYTAWYCPKGKFGHFVAYMATEDDITKHLEECEETKQ